MNKIEKALFDKIYEPKMSLKQLHKTEKLFGSGMFGTLEVKAYENGKLIHHELPSPNKVLVWSKHAMIKLISGEVMENFGGNRMAPELGDQTKGMGTMIADGQFMDGISNYTDSYNYQAINWTDSGSIKYPYFPTKMLFGTGNGMNVGNYSGINSSDVLNPEATILDETETLDIIKEGWVQSIHSPTSVTGVDRYGMTNTGTWNWSNFTKETYQTDFDNWLPSFVFAKRMRPYDFSSSEEILKYDYDLPEYNKIRFKVILPAQSASQFYPYNDSVDGGGCVLKYAGLFCDAGWAEYDNGTKFQLTEQSPGNEFKYGICWAKKAIIPIIKTPTISIDYVWSFYIPRDL